MGLSLYKIIFAFQLMLGEWLFLFRLSRRPYFGFRATISVAVLLIIAAFFPVLYYNAWYVSFLFFALFGCTLVALIFCFEEPFENLMFCGIAGYTVQHLAYLLYTFVNEATRIGETFGGIVDPYADSVVSLGGIAWLQMLFYIDCYVLIYVVAFCIFDRRLRENHSLRLGRVYMVFLSGLLIIADVIFNMVTIYYTVGIQASLLLERCYNILLCVLILALLSYQISQIELRDELAGVRYLVEQGKHQYEFAKKNVELINMKYHDLRHQSELLEQQLEQQGDWARDMKAELDQILDDYAVQARTGNEVLDVILTEKTMLCRSQNIQLMAVVAGQGLEFIKAHHLYALLGNALDNAMEAVQELPQEQRVISLFIKRQGSLVHIHVENPCDKSPVFRDGLPMTTKIDENYHGFGMMSMKTVAEQYGGGMTAQLEDGIFSLDIVLMDE